MEFQGKVVLITGASGGIGKATTKLFAQEGAKLVLTGTSKEKLETVAKELNLEPDNYMIISTNVAKEVEIAKLVEETVNRFGTIDVFFNNAGIEGKFQMISDTTADNLDEVLDVNLKGVYYGLKYVMPIMMKQKSGSIINTASVAGFIGSPGMAPYVASKHAVLGITKTAALECAERGVRVNAICPAPVNTRMMRSIEATINPDNPEDAKKLFAQMVPMNRYAEPEEIAQVVLFLASDKSSYITGASYRIDGGMSGK
ncbi:SDR family NAD(P)-dependent oxidoreductase [Serpentinicella alkaliphila]|uniref:NAD(P)-dependent dehydrogenase (Short-subunit alcohol dehydrogenase family) n=1 Tax=Serpentinicella alkaliphila TaxID=1734049 RepID=A0A4R2T9D7_9FIRM|nr:SDR family NAD(P)-dependent oxidoreductase [Serpentinicella alkaliphila]QUH26033.1 SDR family oxidoreductase [Serpentinicella alkaliphila]TCP99727.1 NAD(P)-dependent dehydrogenase (short-subunit alcohol dehydrogenase family) [Serpentinicella alkaliphila]